ncbi:MAG: GntR family transcriptional regulator [Lachnospiraceae bacterium]
MILIDYKDTRPLYEQIADKLSQLILCGVLSEDEKMPSVRSLAVELSVNPNTIQKAYVKLEQDGIIYTIKGRGNFVSKKGDFIDEKKRLFEMKVKEMVDEGLLLGYTMEMLIMIIKKGGITHD